MEVITAELVSMSNKRRPKSRPVSKDADSGFNYENENDIKKFSNYDQCLYFTFVTHFTVGFGDISPQSTLLRRLCMLHIFLAFLLFYT